MKQDASVKIPSNKCGWKERTKSCGCIQSRKWRLSVEWSSPFPAQLDVGNARAHPTLPRAGAYLSTLWISSEKKCFSIQNVYAFYCLSSNAKTKPGWDLCCSQSTRFSLEPEAPGWVSQLDIWHWRGRNTGRRGFDWLCFSRPKQWQALGLLWSSS